MVTMAIHTAPLLRSALADVLPQAAGVIIVIFLILALGFVITAYTEAASRRIRPRIVLTRERPEGDLGAAVMPFLLLALLVAIAVVMDRGL
ncbi:MAG: hypothetical protein IPJ14_16145 [Kineosporiaceae bacterium]|nr:hypothetical protein [Kineosporiaceae bacterium]MBK7624144.1 hypothetical protein [Kineosporiaceae bacterium]MBK8075897.1 hypothetical protein [Kineosporiaceae bacterium]